MAAGAALANSTAPSWVGSSSGTLIPSLPQAARNSAARAVAIRAGRGRTPAASYFLRSRWHRPDPPTPQIDPIELRSAMARVPDRRDRGHRLGAGWTGRSGGERGHLAVAGSAADARLPRPRVADPAGGRGRRPLRDQRARIGRARSWHGGSGARSRCRRSGRGSPGSDHDGIPRLDAAIVFVACRMRDLLVGRRPRDRHRRGRGDRAAAPESRWCSPTAATCGSADRYRRPPGDHSSRAGSRRRGS